MPHTDPETRRKYAREWARANRKPDTQIAKERRRTAARKSYQNLTPDQRADRTLRMLYGITLLDKREMLLKQGGQCAVCGVAFKRERDAHVDHDHAHDRQVSPGAKRHKTRCTKTAVRGLLCYLCNNGLGSFRDNVADLESAIAYLKAHRGGRA